LFLLWLGVFGGVISLGALFSSWHFLFDLLSHFRIQYIVLLIAFLCLAFYRQKYSIAVFLGLCLTIHGFDVFRSLKTVRSNNTVGSVSLRVMSSNLLASNTDYDKYSEYVDRVDPDIIVFQEYTMNWDSALSESLAAYPNRFSYPLASPFGIAIYSKSRFLDKRVVFLLSGGSPSLEVTIEVGGKTVKVLGTHPPPPISLGLYRDRNRHLEKLSEFALIQTEPLVIAGDLNVSPWSDHFRDFVTNGGLLDGRRGQGLLPTWPTWFAPLQIPIDHIVVNASVKIVSMETSSSLGSDHKSLWADLMF